MKKYVIYLFLFMFLPLAAMAQSSMTDQQVMQFIVKEHNSGKSQSEIVTKLMQRGVDISQIRRVRNKYERQMKQGGLGNVSDNTKGDKDESRLRTNNGNPRELTKRDDYGKEATQKASQYSSMRLKAERDRKYKNTYDETDEEFMDYQRCQETQGVRTRHLQQPGTLVRAEHEHRYTAELRSRSGRCSLRGYLRRFAEVGAVHRVA